MVSSYTSHCLKQGVSYPAGPAPTITRSTVCAIMLLSGGFERRHLTIKTWQPEDMLPFNLRWWRRTEIERFGTPFTHDEDNTLWSTAATIVASRYLRGSGLSRPLCVLRVLRDAVSRSCGIPQLSIPQCTPQLLRKPHPSPETQKPVSASVSFPSSSLHVAGRSREGILFLPRLYSRYLECACFQRRFIGCCFLLWMHA